MEDAAGLERMGREQDEHIAELVERQRSRLGSFIRRRVPDARDAEDVLQDVFSAFGWPPITFWQAVGILALSRILFGSFGGRGCHRSRWGRRLAERWEFMTPEEQERLRQGMRERFGLDSSPLGSEER